MVMKMMKRILAMVLCLVMVVGIVPVSVFSVESKTALESALDEAKTYIDGITINSSSNDPATVVKNFGTHFTWDNEKRENGKKGAEYGQRGGRPSKNKPQQNPTITPEKPQQNPTETPNANANVNANANENANVESTDALHPIRARKGFQKPTIEEVRAYIFERGYIFDADAFWNYYESNGWKVGKNPMKNWKAACSTWNTKEKQNNSKGYGRNQNGITTNEDVVRNTYEIIREIDQDYSTVREF